MTTPESHTAQLSSLLEQWRQIPGHPEYELSSRGRVRSWKKWLGYQGPVPRILKVQRRSGRRLITLGAGPYHDVDDLMHEVWQAPIVPGDPPPVRLWRRVMLTPRQHEQLVKLLDSLRSPVARNLLTSVRASKKVRWDDPLSPDELSEEPCEP